MARMHRPGHRADFREEWKLSSVRCLLRNKCAHRPENERAPGWGFWLPGRTFSRSASPHGESSQPRTTMTPDQGGRSLARPFGPRPVSLGPRPVSLGPCEVSPPPRPRGPTPRGWRPPTPPRQGATPPSGPRSPLSQSSPLAALGSIAFLPPCGPAAVQNQHDMRVGSMVCVIPVRNTVVGAERGSARQPPGEHGQDELHPR